MNVSRICPSVFLFTLTGPVVTYLVFDGVDQSDLADKTNYSGQVGLVFGKGSNGHMVTNFKKQICCFSAKW